jgi:hypothetical protein
MANLPGMTGEQKTDNRIEMLVECIAMELRMARVEPARNLRYMPMTNPHHTYRSLVGIGSSP